MKPLEPMPNSFQLNTHQVPSKIIMNDLFLEESAPYCTDFPLDSYGQVDWNGMIDPQLDASLSPEFCPDARWSTLPMQRFILGSSQTRQPTPQKQAGFEVPLTRSQADYLFDMPPTSGTRHGSPFSQHRSSTCSSGQSPPPDSDLYLDGLQGPSTPQDLAIASPYITSNQYDHWDNQYSRSSLLEQTFVSGGGCVNPSSLAPTSNKIEGFHEAAPETKLQHRQDHPFDHQSTPYNYEKAPGELEVPSHMPSTDLQLEAHNEIHVKAHSSHPLQYPMPNEMRLNSQPNEAFDKSEHTYDNFNNAKLLSKRRKPARVSDAQRRNLLKRRHVSNHPENALQPFSSHGESGPRLLSMFPNGIVQCDQCNSTFKDETSLRKHKRTEHIRPFTCVFHYAGCTSSFAAKNEWKRHVASQHLSLSYWLCTHGNCAHSRGPSTHQRSSLLPSFGVIFNRKDLFTQHIRRMHSPDDKDPKSKNTSPQLEERLKVMQEQAFRRRCQLPTYMQCPAQHCTSEFQGPGAWDERMEHVARHLEAAAVGDEPPVHFGGNHDTTLTYWAEAEGVEVVKRTPTGWETCNPLKGEGGMRKSNTEGNFGTEQDAEGEAY